MEASTTARLSDDLVADISARAAAVRERIERACARAGRDPAAVTLIAVTKTMPAEVVRAGLRAGLTDLGENRVQEALAKQGELAALPVEPQAPRWHLIGHLQRNKAKAAAAAFAILHAVDSGRLLEAIAAARAPESEALPVMLEVNVGGEASKFGVAPAAAPALIAEARACPAVKLLGLMTVAPFAPSPEGARPLFRTLRRLAEDAGLPALSMGMTNDFEVAIEEGATHVRVGRAIFGERA